MDRRLERERGGSHERLASWTPQRRFADASLGSARDDRPVRLVGDGDQLVWATKASAGGFIRRCQGTSCDPVVQLELSALFDATNVDLAYAPEQRRYVALLAYDSDASTLHTGTLPDIPGEPDAALLTSFIPRGEAMLDIAVGGEELFVLTDKRLYVCSMDSITSDAPCCASTGVAGGLRIAAAEGIVVVQRSEGGYHLARSLTEAPPGG